MSFTQPLKFWAGGRGPLAAFSPRAWPSSQLTRLTRNSAPLGLAVKFSAEWSSLFKDRHRASGPPQTLLTCPSLLLCSGLCIWIQRPLSSGQTHWVDKLSPTLHPGCQVGKSGVPDVRWQRPRAGAPGLQKKATFSVTGRDDQCQKAFININTMFFTAE